MNDEAIPCSRRGKWRNKDQKWGIGTIRSILANPVYYGARTHNRFSLSRIRAQQEGWEERNGSRNPAWRMEEFKWVLQEGGGEVYPYYPPRHWKDRHAYSPFVVRKYFDRELRLTGSSSVEYEILPENIGYAFLSDFHENYLVEEFPGVLDYLKNTKGLGLDIRQKRGGDYRNVEAVVTRFLTAPLARNDAYTYGQEWVLPPFQPRGPFIYSKQRQTSWREETNSWSMRLDS